MKNCICCHNNLKLIENNNNYGMKECLECKTIFISHYQSKSDFKNKDYYQNEYYLQDKISKSIIKTRKRQSKKIINIIRNNIKKPGEIVDFGCGKGTFLRELELSGYKKILGVESSNIVIEELKNKYYFIKVSVVNQNLNFHEVNKDIKSEKLKTLVALDVIEHFEGENFSIWMKNIISTFQNPKFILLKVPSRNGLLFSIAVILSKLNITKRPLDQMLQVNTFPPHYIYFSKKGMINLFNQFGYELKNYRNDLDYEIFCLGDRIATKGLLNLFINKVISPLLAILSKLTFKNESIILLFKQKEIKY